MYAALRQRACAPGAAGAFPAWIAWVLAGWLSLASAAAADGARSARVVLERNTGGTWAAVDPRTVLRSGDTVRFRFEANFAGYLYVLNQTSKGEYLWLFPTPETGLENAIEAGREYAIPSTEGAFRIPPSEGFDTVYWIVSPLKLPELPATPAPPAPPRAKGDSPLRPRCQAGPLRARGLCLDDTAGARALRGAERLPQGLAAPVPDAGQLTVERGETDNRITSGGEGPFVYEFRIAHR